ncbi:MAG: 2'-deoxycytidine 5'-triphosphate deaminase [Thermoproteota archaeon]|nr:2'-deoxycytidine 5'-triphosphate deaminase [Thermoproteota archaeon]
MSAGVLNQEEFLRAFVHTSPAPPGIKTTGQLETRPDPSSIDLPLGAEYFEMSASCRPREDYRVSDLIREHGEKDLPLGDGTVFERGKVYLVRLAWGLELPEGICARSTAKSSIGRLDTLVRLVADHQPEFERIKEGVSTELYAEVSPITFSLRVRPGMSLSQIRFIKGTEELCTVPARALNYEDPPVLVDREGRRAQFKVGEGDPNGVILSLDLSPDPKLGFVGFVAKNDTTEPIDPSVRGPKNEGEPDPRYNPGDFWEPVEARGNTVRIEKDKFYIFRSRERFRIPHIWLSIVRLTLRV